MFTGAGPSVAPRMVVAGAENVEEWVGIHGPIASGKSLLMSRVRAYIDANRQNAENPEHIDLDNPQKIYFLLVEEPVDEWSKKRFSVPGQLEKASMLEMFYNDISGLGFAFQVYVFNSRLERLTQRLAAIAPSPQPRRIVVISERTMLSDRVFYHTVSDQNREEGVAHAEALRFIYDQFFATICGDVLQKEKRLIYLPTAPDVCATRKQIRDRDGEKVSADYLNRLDKQHKRMVSQFADEHGQEAVLRLDEFNEHLTVAQIDDTVSAFMGDLFV